MMKVFFDTNVVLEFLQKRAQADMVEKALDIISSNNSTKHISVGSFYTLTYLIERHIRKTTTLSSSDRIQELRTILLGILDDFCITLHDSVTLRSGVENEKFDDLEDSYQAEVAIHSGCDVLLTINTKDFQGMSSDARINILTPSEFVQLYEGKD